MLRRTRRQLPAGAAAQPTLYGLVAQFDDPDKLIQAAAQARSAGYTKLDAFSPIPLHGLEEALGLRRTRLPWLIFAGGLAGAAGIFALATWVNLVAYPINIGGRPLFSWPAFIPITFEGMVLLASFAAVFGMILLNGLPMPYHPVFNTPNFERATTDLFFLAVESSDPQFDLTKTRQFLESLGAQQVSSVNN
ncbi:MAG: DUF3341 domain-containing protein [Chloroflexota bacterium]|nr:MAG: DUF3341 domain-containing protein [Chloroflexota bacterium]